MLVLKKKWGIRINVLAGNHPKKMKLDDISTLNPVSIGDTIITGGMSDYFPYGIPIRNGFKNRFAQNLRDIMILI